MAERTKEGAILEDLKKQLAVKQKLARNRGGGGSGGGGSGGGGGGGAPLTPREGGGGEGSDSDSDSDSDDGPPEVVPARPGSYLMPDD